MRASLKNRRTVLISFSGIDGAGKSTQIANLRSRLQKDGFHVQLITFWDDVATLKPIREGAGYKLFKGDKGVGKPEAPIHRRDKNVRSPGMTIVRLAIYILDAISLRKVVRNVLRSEADVVIFDRYIYDELANLNLQNSAVLLYLRGIMKLVPRPEVGFVLDADPEQARARKPEYPLEFLYANRDSYLKLSKVMTSITVIPPMSPEKTEAEVIRCVLHETSLHDLRNNTPRNPEDKKPACAKARPDGHKADPVAF